MLLLKTGREPWGGVRGGRREAANPQNPLRWPPSWLSDARATRKDPESDRGPNTMTGQRQARKEARSPKARDCEPCGRAVLLGSLAPLLSAWAPPSNDVSCFISAGVSLDSSFLSVKTRAHSRALLKTPSQGLPLPASESWLLASFVIVGKLLYLGTLHPGTSAQPLD